MECSFGVHCEFRNTQREKSGVVRGFIDVILIVSQLASSAGKILKYGKSDFV